MRFAALLAIPIAASAASLTVSWDQSTDPSVIAHLVRYGPTSATKTNFVNVLGTNSVTIAFPDNIGMVLDVTAINSIGMKSIPSPEVTFNTTPPPAPTNIRVIAQ